LEGRRCGGRGKKWWNKAIEELVHRKKDAYRKWLNSRTAEHKKDYRELSRKVKESVEEAKKRAWEEFGKELQDHFSKNPKMFWKKVSGGKRQDRLMLRNSEGKVIQEEKEVAEHCRLYFERLLNEGFIENGVTESPREGGSEGNNDATIPPTRAEIRREIVRLVNGKAAGESGIVAEFLKAGTPLLVGRLESFFKRVWEEEIVPKDWLSGVVIPLHKKGDKMNLDNYRGITLMDVVGKVFSGIVRNRIERVFMDKIAEEQGGFRKERGCVDQSYTLAQTVLKRLEKKKDTYLCFIVLKKAYDSVWREGLFRKMEQEGVPVKLVRVWYQRVNVKVRVNDVLSSSFETKVGV
jgi:hypothetical protein